MLSCHMLSSPPGLLPFGWLVAGHLFVSCLNLEASIEGQEVAFLFSLDPFIPLSLVDVYPSLQSQPIRSVVSEGKKDIFPPQTFLNNWKIPTGIQSSAIFLNPLLFRMRMATEL